MRQDYLYRAWGGGIRDGLCVLICPHWRTDASTKVLLTSVADPDPVFMGHPDPYPKKMDRIRNTASNALDSTQFIYKNGNLFLR